jgi:hypothetical protein
MGIQRKRRYLLCIYTYHQSIWPTVAVRFTLQCIYTVDAQCSLLYEYETHIKHILLIVQFHFSLASYSYVVSFINQYFRVINDFE